MCGIMAAEYRAMSVSAVDRCITNRHLVIQGDAGYVVSMPETTGEKKKRFIQFMQGDEKGGSIHIQLYNLCDYIYIDIEQTRESWEGLGYKATGVRYDMFVTFATKMSNNWNWDKLYMWRREQHEVIHAQNWMWLSTFVNSQIWGLKAKKTSDISAWCLKKDHPVGDWAMSLDNSSELTLCCKHGWNGGEDMCV